MTPAQDLEYNHAEVLAKYYRASGRNLVEVVKHPYFQKMSFEAQKQFLMKHRSELSAEPNLAKYLSKDLLGIVLSLSAASIAVGKIAEKFNHPEAGQSMMLGLAGVGMAAHLGSRIQSYVQDKALVKDLKQSDPSDLSAKILKAVDSRSLGVSPGPGYVSGMATFYEHPAFLNQVKEDALDKGFIQ